MPEFQFDKLPESFVENSTSKGLWLWVWHADKIPPHIGCSVDGSYYSLKVNGKDLGIADHRVVSVITHKKIPSLIIEVNVKVDPEKVIRTFAEVELANAENNTCLSPILGFLKTPVEVEKLSHLLFYLEERSELGRIFGLNLKEGFSGIPAYGKKEIEERLRLLEHAKRQKNISSIG